MSHKRFDIFVSTSSGLLKGNPANFVGDTAIYSNKIGPKDLKDKIKKLDGADIVSPIDEVTRIAWGDEDEREILVACGRLRKWIKIFDPDSSIPTRMFRCDVGSGRVKGISRYNGSILTAVECGTVTLWSYDGDGEILLNAREKLCKMCHSRVQKNIIGTGGWYNMLKLYDLETQKQIFQEKYLRHDQLELQRPYSISDMDFLPSSQELVTVSRHGNIHLYDPRLQRRPVMGTVMPNEAWTCLAIPPTKEKHVIVGSAKGRVNLVDLRKPLTILNTYKGFTGAVTAVACSTSNPYVASVSFDRHLRIHDINTKEVLKCIYLNSLLSGVIIRSDIEIETSNDVE